MKPNGATRHKAVHSSEPLNPGDPPTAGPASDAPRSVQRIPPDWGGPLTENDYAALQESWITPAIAEAAMLCRVNGAEGLQIVGQKGTRDCSGILIPYYLPGESYAHSYRIRRDNPEWTQDKEGNVKPKAKYLGAPCSGNRLYFPHGITKDQLEDVTIPIVIVEGEKKALALQRLAYHESEKPRFIAIAIPGVWSWLGTVGKANGPKGERVDLKGPINDLSWIVWEGRDVIILFDANVQTNDSVKRARKGIARELATRKAGVKFVNLPDDCGVNGVDDLLAAWGPARVLEIFEKPVVAASLQVILPPQFKSRPEGLFRISSQNSHLVEIQLTNYEASVVTNTSLDDGVETKREFDIEATLMGRQFCFTIPASAFMSMEWPIEKMGACAFIYPGQREYARAAIQALSIGAEDHRVFTHTGWRRIDERWVFLHAAGAISADGVVDGTNVRLSGTLARYELRHPTTPEALALAVRSSLRLVHLGPPAICFPLLAATYRAVFGDADFALHIEGMTGAFKSEVAALHQQHFGVAMNRLNLPGAWSSTANNLEAVAFHAKDTLLVIDDFAPQGSAADVARYHAAADRVFRAAGNRAGRGRLDSTARLREPKPPRALILSTGEDIPRGQSVRARLLILELAKGMIDVKRLTECQKNAADGLYAEAMAGFLQRMAGRYEETVAAFRQRVSDLRTAALRNPAHARTPEIIASLQAAFDVFLEFAEECGVLTTELRRQLADQCWDALRQAAEAQGKHQMESEPAARFLSQLRASLSSGQAHLASRSGGVSDISPADCGWRQNGGNWLPQGPCIGWVDGADLYLEPTTAYEVVQVAGRNSGEALPVSRQVLKKRLREKGFLASIDERRDTLTVRRSIGGSSKSVLHLLRSTLLPEDPADDLENRGAGGE